MNLYYNFYVYLNLVNWDYVYPYAMNHYENYLRHHRYDICANSRIYRNYCGTYFVYLACDIPHQSFHIFLYNDT